MLDQNQEISSKLNQLISVPGIGQQLALTVLTELPQAGKGEFKKLTSLVGLAPYANESGKQNPARRIKAGKAKIRKVLYMATVASLRVNPKIKRFYDTLIQNHKKPKVALVACMRILLSFIHAILKNNSTWKTQN